jgi:hypothetical protein
LRDRRRDSRVNRFSLGAMQRSYLITINLTRNTIGLARIITHGHGSAVKTAPCAEHVQGRNEMTRDDSRNYRRVFPGGFVSTEDSVITVYDAQIMTGDPAD